MRSCLKKKLKGLGSWLKWQSACPASSAEFNPQYYHHHQKKKKKKKKQKNKKKTNIIINENIVYLTKNFTR
jgi:hypothetical protein